MRKTSDSTPGSKPPLLYLVHRIPYPPNKGDKLRSFNILKQLARNYRVVLGTFVDDPADTAHIDTLRQWCTDILAVPLNPVRARLLSLRGLLSFEALSVPYYRDARLQHWVVESVARLGIRHAVAFSGPMAQYLDIPDFDRRVVDFCDLDSAKWTQYAADRRWPMSWLYRREGIRLLAFEKSWAEQADASTFVTAAEADLLRRQLPAVADRIHAIQNGVDADYFSPVHEFESPYPVGGPVVVFTGAMDYWPNIDAVTWFAQEILPVLRDQIPEIRFYIVGMNPAPAVHALVSAGVVVTGKVPDVRPWIKHADAVVAPLRVARGIQNKVLEAMAMGKAVIVSAASATGLAGEAGHDFITAESVTDFVRETQALLSYPVAANQLGAQARQCVEHNYSWQAHLTRFDALLG